MGDHLAISGWLLQAPLNPLKTDVSRGPQGLSGGPGPLGPHRNSTTAKRAAATSACSDATVLKLFSAITSLFFVVDRKQLHFWNLNFSTCDYMQIFNFRDDHVTTFRHPSGAYICQTPVHKLSRLAIPRHTFRVSAFHRYHWFLG